MKMALIDPTGVVVGLLDWDTAKTFTPPEGHHLQVPQGAHVGDTWTGTNYTPAGLDADNRATLIAKGHAYLALATPTAAQTTKAVRALVMIAVDSLTDIAGT